MYDYIRGTIVSIKENHVVVENHGIGYRIYVTTLDREQLRENAEAAFQISFVMRDDGIWLYGFLDGESLAVFELLTTVSTIGPKNAMAILSHCPVPDLCEAVLTDDIQILTQIPGVGKKTAGRLVLELADKLAPFRSMAPSKKPLTARSDDANIVLEALQNLGYVRREIEEVLLDLNLEQMHIEEVIKESIKRLS